MKKRTGNARHQTPDGSLALGHATKKKPQHVSSIQQNSEHDSPPLYKVLPDVIAQPIGPGKFLDEMFDGVLSEPEKVGSGDRVGVLAITDRVRLFDDRRPCSCRRPSYHRPIRNIRRHYLELGSISAIENGTVIYGVASRVHRRMVASGPSGQRRARAKRRHDRLT